MKLLERRIRALELRHPPIDVTRLPYEELVALVDKTRIGWTMDPFPHTPAYRLTNEQLDIMIGIEIGSEV